MVSEATWCTFCGIEKGTTHTEMIQKTDSTMVFHNRLSWASVMLLVAPRAHFSQREAWTSDILPQMTAHAIEMGEKYCPQGFRLVSNFDQWGHQTIRHSHIHVVSQVDDYIAERSKYSHIVNRDMTMKDLWTSQEIVAVGTELTSQGDANSKSGYRIMANYYPKTHAVGGGPARMRVQGGHQLGLYA